MTTPTRTRPRARGQVGAYAVEYAIVFPVLFVVTYAIISYAILFSVRLGMQNAAEEGARAALRYQAISASGCNTQLACRKLAAQTVAQERIDWLPNATVEAKACLLNTDDSCTSSSVPACGSTLDQRCQMIVTVSYDYATRPLAPPLPGLGFLLPNKLQGRASMLMGDPTAVNQI
ncbi:TadE/TadG family type IV pilus assembly protein [Variovorax sp. H27-G14]|uniref:TadE/TadG family type IV pilus assembly protein n=1 Tax=Variovorax sp. H27-G14 TaxID=3111914 RepID=UPI0038FD121D